LSEILLGHPPVGKRSKTEIEKLQFDLEKDCFAVLIYSFGGEKTDELSMRQFVLTNVTDELLSDDGYRFVSTKKDEDIVYIICADENLAKKLESTVNFLNLFTQKEFEFEFFGASGSVQNGVKGIYSSFNEAKRALEYSIAAGKKEHVSYPNIAESLKDGYFYTVELETRFVVTAASTQVRFLLYNMSYTAL
jgi:sugar diacid utilization regulator